MFHKRIFLSFFVPLDSEGGKKKYLGNLKLFVIHGKKEARNWLSQAGQVSSSLGWGQLGWGGGGGPPAEFPIFTAAAGSKSNPKPQMKRQGHKWRRRFSQTPFPEMKSCSKTTPSAGFKFETGLATPAFSQALISSCWSSIQHQPGDKGHCSRPPEIACKNIFKWLFYFV